MIKKFGQLTTWILQIQCLDTSSHIISIAQAYTLWGETFLLI